MKKNSRQITTILRVSLAFFFILCSVGAISIFIGCKNQWIMDLTDSMFCEDCGRTNVKCICVPVEPIVDLVSITVTAQPGLVYNHGDNLDLSGLAARLTYSDGTTGDVAFADFGAHGITANPAHNTQLNRTEHDGQPVLVMHGDITASTNNLTVNPAQITSVAITVTPPVLGETPDTAVSGTGNFTAGAAAWTRTDGGTMDDVFISGTQYTASVVLTANANYTFPAGFTVQINGGAAAVADNIGAEVTVSRSFTTEAAVVTGITVKAQPAKALNSYTHGDTLNLAGLEATLSYNDGSTKDVVFAEFGNNNIIVSLVNGTVLKRTTHNGQSLTVSRGSGISATVGALTVAQADQAALTVTDPGAKTFGDSDFQLSVTGGSGDGDVTYALVSGPGTVTSNTVTITGAGSIVVSATKAGDNNFKEVSSADRTITVNPQAITSAAISVTTPVNGETPDPDASIGTVNFTVGAAVWTRTDGGTMDDVFIGGTQYTATVVLTANANYTFPTTGFTAQINSGATSIADNTGTAVTVSRSFTTEAAAVTGITVKAQPSKAFNSYTHGEILNLAGLVVELSYNDSTTRDVVLADFGDNSITVSLADGTLLNRSTHNGLMITVSRVTLSANIGALTVAQAVPAALTPPTASAITYGAALSTSTLTGGSTGGTWAWAASANPTTTIPPVTNPGYSATFTPTDTANYNWTGIILTHNISINVNPQAITNAAITVTAPVKNTAPSTTATGTGSFTVGTATWSSASGVLSGNFLAGTQYTATVTLTANANYTFTGGLSTATINGFTATVINNGATAVLNYQFAATAAAVINITANPAATTTLTAGSITATNTLSVAASADEGATLSYQWYSNTSASTTGGTAVTGATSASFPIPTTLTAGTYYYFCEVSATLGATAVRSFVATVIVQQNVSFTITYAEITDDAPTPLATGETLSRASNGSITFTVAASFTNIEWYVNGEKVGSENSNSFTVTLDPDDDDYIFDFDRDGLHLLTVFADGYSKVVSFEVVP